MQSSNSLSNNMVNQHILYTGSGNCKQHPRAVGKGRRVARYKFNKDLKGIRTKRNGSLRTSKDAILANANQISYTTEPISASSTSSTTSTASEEAVEVTRSRSDPRSLIGSILHNPPALICSGRLNPNLKNAIRIYSGRNHFVPGSTNETFQATSSEDSKLYLEAVEEPIFSELSNDIELYEGRRERLNDSELNSGDDISDSELVEPEEAKVVQNIDQLEDLFDFGHAENEEEREDEGDEDLRLDDPVASYLFQYRFR